MTGSWRPSATVETLRERARLARRTREFFAARGVVEVSTPLLGRSTASDPHVHSLEVDVEVAGAPARYYLQPSPESAMKRLLAAGSGAIYQLGPAFRRGERGGLHNPEFTLLEWYRPGFDLARLLDEVDELLGDLLGVPAGRRLSYAQAFASALDLDPFEAPEDALRRAAGVAGLAGVDSASRAGLLDFLFSARVQPTLGHGVAHVVGFPAEQAAMARTDGAVARRAEVFVDGIELANGYEELVDCAEQRARFERDLELRRRDAAAVPPIDEALLGALAHGIPPTAGIALGFDRLVMRATGAARIEEVIAFPVERA